MKKILLVVALASFGFTNAQVKEKGVIEITPKIGTSSFSEYNEENNSTEFNSGVELGATVDYYFNNRWSLRSGLIFDKMGGKYDVGDPFLWEDQLNYLSIPVNANWHFGSTRKWNLNFGLAPSFLMSAKLKENGYTSDIPSSEIKSFQLGFTFGIGYKIGITEKFGILIDAQWFNGLTNINKTNSSEITNGGYSFNLGGVIQL
ncbi:porin family protein [Flavobacterium acetivorans]|uniref:porin family protein n=1 Tax=Flavobacterium acetivorans TaxID=2893883 RepID=UPI001E2E2C27|nr:porin family protein [Flavobacterium sp. F-29]UFH36243.1 PorT family protein [Flavobacterium sp. F-29]